MNPERQSSEWWRWQLLRKMAEFFYNPNPQREAELHQLISHYHQQKEHNTPSIDTKSAYPNLG